MAPVRFIATATSRLRKAFSSEIHHNISLGKQGEEMAVRYLAQNGYKILRRNFRAPRGGELDIVCRDKCHNELVFVEVKTRSSDEFGRPFDAVNMKKRRLLIRGAMAWLRMLEMPDITFRFDVVEVIASSPPQISVIKNAFQLPDHYSY